MQEIDAGFEPKIGIVTALGIEYLAMKAVVDSGEEKPIRGIGKCLMGTILSHESGIHHLVVAEAGMGNNMSALCAEKLRHEFPSIDTFIMVGIAGAVPNPEKSEDHVRLGDIVVVGKEGVVQYDFIKKTESEIQYRHPPRAPKASLLKAAEVLRREEEEGKFPWNDYIKIAINVRGEEWKRPPATLDILEYPKGNIVIHPQYPKRREGEPRVFIGVIASGNTLLKDPIIRDRLRKDLSAKAVEMEASGVADASWINEVNYFAVRGMCDYCDGNKNDIWQKYASIVAAAYTKALLVSVPGIVSSPSKKEPVSPFTKAGTFNVLILPFDALEKSHAREVHYERALQKRLMGLKEEEGLEIDVAYLDDEKQPISFEDGIQIGRKYKADLVIWGDYYEQGQADSMQASLRYALVDIELPNVKPRGKSDILPVPTLTLISQGYLQQDVDYAIYWVLAHIQFKTRNYERALHYFKYVASNFGDKFQGVVNFRLDEKGFELKINRPSVQLLYYLAFCYYATGDLEKAVVCWSNILMGGGKSRSGLFAYNTFGLAISSSNKEAVEICIYIMLYRAVAFETLGNKTSAIEDYMNLMNHAKAVEDNTEMHQLFLPFIPIVEKQIERLRSDVKTQS